MEEGGWTRRGVAQNAKVGSLSFAQQQKGNHGQSLIQGMTCSECGLEGPSGTCEGILVGVNVRQGRGGVRMTSVLCGVGSGRLLGRAGFRQWQGDRGNVTSLAYGGTMCSPFRSRKAVGQLLAWDWAAWPPLCCDESHPELSPQAPALWGWRRPGRARPCGCWELTGASGRSIRVILHRAGHGHPGSCVGKVCVCERHV